MKRIKTLFILMIICVSLAISVHGSFSIEQPGPRPTGIYPIETAIVDMK